MQKYIYLVLSRSSSLPAKIIRFFTRDEVNHSSISLDDSLTAMYSFGRRKINTPFWGGMVLENKDRGFYAKFTDTYIKLYRFPVSEEVFERTRDLLESNMARKDEFEYNLAGCITAKFGIPLARKDHYFCSEYVADVFQTCGIREIKRNIHTYRPIYFEELPDKELSYTGLLREYVPARERIPVGAAG